jgi:hypothetical protein
MAVGWMVGISFPAEADIILFAIMSSSWTYLGTQPMDTKNFFFWNKVVTSWYWPLTYILCWCLQSVELYVFALCTIFWAQYSEYGKLWLYLFYMWTTVLITAVCWINLHGTSSLHYSCACFHKRSYIQYYH